MFKKWFRNDFWRTTLSGFRWYRSWYGGRWEKWVILAGEAGVFWIPASAASADRDIRVTSPKSLSHVRLVQVRVEEY